MKSKVQKLHFGRDSCASHTAPPSATQKEIAVEIGKSERTVKSITVALQEKNVIQRINGKRNGYWSIVDE